MVFLQANLQYGIYKPHFIWILLIKPINFLKLLVSWGLFPKLFMCLSILPYCAYFVIILFYVIITPLFIHLMGWPLYWHIATNDSCLPSLWCLYNISPFHESMMSSSSNMMPTNVWLLNEILDNLFNKYHGSILSNNPRAFSVLLNWWVVTKKCC